VEVWTGRGRHRVEEARDDVGARARPSGAGRRVDGRPASVGLPSPGWSRPGRLGQRHAARRWHQDGASAAARPRGRGGPAHGRLARIAGHQRQRALAQQRAGAAREGEPELGALPGPAPGLQPAAVQVGVLERDREAEAGAALVRARAGSARQKRLKTSADSPAPGRRRSRARRPRRRGRRRRPDHDATPDSAWSIALVTRLRTIRSTRRGRPRPGRGAGRLDGPVTRAARPGRGSCRRPGGRRRPG
jgi:hypothetical protein